MPTFNTFDLVPPRRPSLADFNGASKQDNTAFAPNVVTMPNAAEWNTMGRLLVALGQAVSTARVQVNAGVGPTVQSVIAPGTLVNGQTNAFVVTRVAQGEYWVECACGESGMAPGAQPQLPNVTSAPGGNMLSATTSPYVLSCSYGSGPAYDNQAIHVFIADAAGPADVNFVVEFF